MQNEATVNAGQKKLKKSSLKNMKDIRKRLLKRLGVAGVWDEQ